MNDLPALSPNAWLRWDVVSRLLLSAVEPGCDVLEVGCGQGGFGVRLAQRYRYVGVEPDPLSYEVARSRVEITGRGEVRHGDLSALTPDERFDLVCAFEVIEHIEDDQQALNEWAQRLRPGGTLLLSTPAYQSRFRAADEMVGHFRRYDPLVLRNKLAAAGLVDIELRHFGAPLGYVLEAGRNAVGRRRLARLEGADMTTRSHGSGRLLQPSKRKTAAAAQYGTWPFRRLQRAFPNRGPGLIAAARKPR